MLDRRLQVFVSSTYSDLREERQAAVEAILSAGHIPAGMELFAAGDQSQLTVIKEWIDDSDVYLLILGGRFGSIEPTSGKSYIQLEYEHAVTAGKPIFSCVIESKALEARVKEKGTEAIELSDPRGLKTFQGQVLSRMVRFWADAKDIKLAIHESLGTFMRRPELVGWVRGDRAVNAAPLADEIARLTRENSELHWRLEGSQNLVKIVGLDFREMTALLDQRRIEPGEIGLNLYAEWSKICREIFGSEQVTLLGAIWILRRLLEEDPKSRFPYEIGKALEMRGLAFWSVSPVHGHTISLTSEGMNFLNRLDFEKGVPMATEP